MVMKREITTRHVRPGSRLCENASEPRTLRIVFSIALCQQHLSVRLVSAATKSRWKFYAQVQRLSFHAAWTRSRHPRAAAASIRIAIGEATGAVACLRLRFLQSIPK